MKILLLGGFGFIGTNIIKYIDNHHKGDFSVVVFDKLPVHPFGIKGKCVDASFSGDFSDAEVVKSVFKKRRFDIIIHAISTTVPATSKNARYDIESNLVPTVDLLNLLVEYDHKRIIYISSGGAIYGESNAGSKHKETDDTFPKSSYGVVKLAAEKYLFQYSSLYSVEPLILRLSNPYGSYHYSSKQGITNVALRAAKGGKRFKVWGTGDALKDYIYIEDFCDILFQLIKKDVSGKILNIGSEQILSLREILIEIKRLYPDFTWDFTDPNIYDLQHFELDITELRKLIGDYRFTDFRDGLARTNNWLRDHGN